MTRPFLFAKPPGPLPSGPGYGYGKNEPSGPPPSGPPPSQGGGGAPGAWGGGAAPSQGSAEYYQYWQQYQAWQVRRGTSQNSTSPSTQHQPSKHVLGHCTAQHHYHYTTAMQTSSNTHIRQYNVMKLKRGSMRRVDWSVQYSAMLDTAICHWPLHGTSTPP